MIAEALEVHPQLLCLPYWKEASINSEQDGSVDQFSDEAGGEVKVEDGKKFQEKTALSPDTLIYGVSEHPGGCRCLHRVFIGNIFCLGKLCNRRSVDVDGREAGLLSLHRQN